MFSFSYKEKKREYRVNGGNVPNAYHVEVRNLGT